MKKYLEIIPSKPFVFDSTFYKPDHFPTKDTAWEPGKRWQTMLWKGQRLGLVFEDIGTKQSPKIGVKVFSRKKLSKEYQEGLKAEFIWRYNLKLDLSEFYKVAKKDKVLSPIVNNFYGLRPMHPGSMYEYLIIGIVLQNCTVKRSVYMMQTLFESYGTLMKFDDREFWSFWEPKKLSRESTEQKLRRLKFGYRAKSLVKVSKPFARGEIDEIKLRRASEEKQRETLINLYGVGPATVGYMMDDVFHRWGYLDHISPWEQKIYTKLFFNKDYEKELVPVEKMLKYFERWGKWKRLAIHYIWQDLWWKRRNENIPWLEKLIRL